MAWKEYITAAKSTIYDGEGLKKPIFTTIMMMVQEPPEDGGKPNMHPQHDGYCWGAISEIAERNGCDERTVKKFIPVYIADGLLVMEKWFTPGNRRPHNRYRPTASCLERLQDIKRHKGDKRQTNANLARGPMQRGKKGQFFSPQGNSTPPLKSAIDLELEKVDATMKEYWTSWGCDPDDYPGEPPKSRRAPGALEHLQELKCSKGSKRPKTSNLVREPDLEDEPPLNAYRVPNPHYIEPIPLPVPPAPETPHEEKIAACIEEIRYAMDSTETRRFLRTNLVGNWRSIRDFGAPVYTEAIQQALEHNIIREAKHNGYYHRGTALPILEPEEECDI